MDETNAEPVYFMTADYDVLKGYICRKDPPSPKWLIYFLPNAANAESSLRYANYLSNELGVNVLVFNYRGVGDSTGFPTSADDLIQDGKACFEYLQKREGVDNLDKVCVYGHSLGGAVAAQVLADEKYRNAHLIVDRSFSSLGDLIENITSEEIGLGHTIGSWAKNLFSSYNWDLNTVANIDRIKGRVLILSTKMIPLLDIVNWPML